jgi:hypothetical protein
VEAVLPEHRRQKQRPKLLLAPVKNRRVRVERALVERALAEPK